VTSIGGSGRRWGFAPPYIFLPSSHLLDFEDALFGIFVGKYLLLKKLKKTTTEFPHRF